MTISRCLIIDVETTGVDPTKDKIIELGLILYSVTNQTVLEMYSRLYEVSENAAENVNHIGLAALKEVRGDAASRSIIIDDMLMDADVLVAHNAAFDSQFFQPEKDWPHMGSEAPRIWPWVCTYSDFEWPKESRHRDLASICLAHGLTVDGSRQHRAMADCQMIENLFNHMADLPSMFERAMRPKALYRADVSREDKDTAKEQGFRWHKEAERWERSCFVDDVAAFPFPVTQVDVFVPDTREKALFISLAPYEQKDAVKEAGFKWNGAAKRWEKMLVAEDPGTFPFRIQGL